MLVLRDYQERSIKALREGIRKGHTKQILYGPTGCGKTEQAISLLNETKKAGNRAAMVLDRRILVNQTSERLERYGIDHGVIMADHWRYRPEQAIQICSAQTLEAKGSFPDIQLLLIDEAHAQRSATTEFIKNTHIKTIGLTATPFTKGLANIYSNVVCEVTTDQLVNDSQLVPLKVFISKEINMTGAVKVGGEWSNKDATERGIRITGDIVAEWTKKTHEFFDGPEKTIVFCAGVAHGADLAEKFAEAGFNFVSISHKDSEQYKDDVIKEFAKPDSTIHGLISTDILTKGFDVPSVKIGISARPFTKSFSSHVQQMGRVMRNHPSKTFGLWLDHSGNYLRFKSEWEDLYIHGVSELIEGAEKPKKEPTDEEKEAAKCPKCAALWPPKTDVCANCGHTRVMRNEVIVTAGELVELGSSLREQADHKRSFYYQLLSFQDEKGYKTTWAALQYKEKFGSWPNWTSAGREAVTAEVRRWIQYTQIKFSKRRIRR